MYTFSFDEIDPILMVFLLREADLTRCRDKKGDLMERIEGSLSGSTNEVFENDQNLEFILTKFPKWYGSNKCIMKSVSNALIDYIIEEEVSKERLVNMNPELFQLLSKDKDATKYFQEIGLE